MFMCVYSFSQGTAQKVIDLNGDDYFNAMTQPLPDGSRFVIGSTSATGGGSYDIGLVKLDSTGNIVWGKQYGGSGFDAGRNITLTADHHLVLVGSSSSFGSSNDVLIIKTDFSGTVVWAKTFGTNRDDFSYKVSEDQDSTLLVIGQTMGAAKDTNRGEMLLVKIDKDGGALWTKTIGSATGVEVGYEGFNIGSGYVIGGQSDLGLIGGKDVAVHLISLTGDLMMTAIIGGTGDDDARKFAPAKNGLIIAGNTRSFGAPNQGDMFVTSIDGSGGTLSLNFFKRIGNITDESLTSFNFDGNNAYVGSALSNGNSGLIFGVDTNGSVTWCTKFDSTGTDVMMDANRGPDGVFGIGYTNSVGSASSNNGYVVRGNMQGTTPCLSSPIALNDTAITATILGPVVPQYTADTLTMTATNVTSTLVTTNNNGAVTVICPKVLGIAEFVDQEMMLFPNPTSSWVTLRSTAMAGRSAEVTVSDMSGRVIMHTSGNSTSDINFHTSGWDSGCYVVRLNLGDKQITRRLIVE